MQWRRFLRNRLLLGVIAASLLLLCAVGGCAAFSILMIKITGRGCIYSLDLDSNTEEPRPVDADTLDLHRL